MGLTAAAAAALAAAARGECHAPVQHTRPSKSIGVHMSLTDRPRPMPPAAAAAGEVAAAGGRPGWFDPLRVGICQSVFFCLT